MPGRGFWKGFHGVIQKGSLWKLGVPDCWAISGKDPTIWCNFLRVPYFRKLLEGFCNNLKALEVSIRAP